MLKNTGDQVDALEPAEKAKKQNIVDMAVGFTAMMPLLDDIFTLCGDITASELREL